MVEGRIHWISGPVLRARSSGLFHVQDAIAVGPSGLLGEIVRLGTDEIVAQVYEDTTGLKPGDAVTGTGQPLSVKLGPSLLGQIFDGLLRPLSGAGSFIQPGVGGHSSARFPFEPAVRAGDLVREGQSIGAVATATRQQCLAPPRRGGVVVSVAAAGEYTEDEPICQLLGADGVGIELSLAQHWPVRQPRPSERRLPLAGPMITGTRILDTLFPIARGGRAAIPGSFGTGKTVLQQSLAKWSDADIIVYVGCGERGNEMAEVLDEFPQLEDPKWATADGAHRDHCQHLQHAGRGARGQHLHRGDRGGILPRSGTARRVNGRLDEPLGRGTARGERSIGRAAGRGRISRLPELAARPVL